MSNFNNTVKVKSLTCVRLKFHQQELLELQIECDKKRDEFDKILILRRMQGVSRKIDMELKKLIEKGPYYEDKE
jgi:hypothetical protein